MTGRHRHQLVVAVTAFSLVTLSAPISAQDKPDLWGAVVRGDVDTVRQALGTGVDPDVLEPNGATPLIVGAMLGHTDLVRFLIDREAALDVQNNDGATALHVAALFGHPESVELLLGAGAARDLQNNNGLTALDLVSGPWTAETDGLYGFLGMVFEMDLDVDRIREVRPELHILLQ